MEKHSLQSWTMMVSVKITVNSGVYLEIQEAPKGGSTLAIIIYVALKCILR